MYLQADVINPKGVAAAHILSTVVLDKNLAINYMWASKSVQSSP